MNIGGLFTFLLGLDNARLDKLEQMLGTIIEGQTKMATQADVDALVERLRAIEAVEDRASVVLKDLPDRIKAAVAEAMASNPGVNLDLSGVEAIVADLEAHTADLESSLPVEASPGPAPIATQPEPVPADANPTPDVPPPLPTGDDALPPVAEPAPVSDPAAPAATMAGSTSFS